MIKSKYINKFNIITTINFQSHNVKINILRVSIYSDELALPVSFFDVSIC